MSDHLDLLIKGGLVVTSQAIARADVGIRNEKVAELAPEVSQDRAARTIDARGKLPSPGIVDVQVHPVYLDDLGTVSVTAAYGGAFTTGLLFLAGLTIFLVLLLPFLREVKSQVPVATPT